MKPLGDVQGNFSYGMKISVNNETLKYFSTTQKVQKELLTPKNTELWYYWKGRFYDEDITPGKLEKQVLNKWKLMSFTIPSVVILSVRRAYITPALHGPWDFLWEETWVCAVENCNQAWQLKQ